MKGSAEQIASDEQFLKDTDERRQKEVAEQLSLENVSSNWKNMKNFDILHNCIASQVVSSNIQFVDGTVDSVSEEISPERKKKRPEAASLSETVSTPQ